MVVVMMVSLSHGLFGETNVRDRRDFGSIGSHG